MDLKSFLKLVPDFPKPGIMFIDITSILARPKVFGRSVDEIVEEWIGKVDAVTALETRGYFFGAPVAINLGVPFFPIRKKGKLPGETIAAEYSLEYGKDGIEMKKDAVAPGARVLVVDDVLATGGTAAAACTLIERANAKVAGCAFVIELQDLFGRNKLLGRTIQSLVTYTGEELRYAKA
jgi:adenine phosphoribosyltransferase